MEKIKIAFVLDQIDYQMGGTERQILLLLDNIDKSIFDVHLCFFKNTQWIINHQNIYNIFFFDFSSFKKTKSYFQWYGFVKYLKRKRFDILISFFMESNKLAIPAAKLAGISNILLSRRNIGYWINKKEDFILKLLKRWVTHYWVNAKAIKESLIHKYKIDSNCITVTYNGFEFDESKYSNIHDELKLDKDCCLITNVSNLRAVKGLDVFVNASSIVLQQSPNVHFVIVGEGDERDKLEHLIKKLNIENHVSLIGRRTDITGILKRSSVGVLSSHSEGLSNSIIEYMAAGLPVVCTEVGGAKELVENNKNGFLISPNNPEEMAEKIYFLIQNPSRACEMGDISYKKAKSTFSLNEMVNNSENFFKSLINNNVVN